MLSQAQTFMGRNGTMVGIDTVFHSKATGPVVLWSRIVQFFPGAYAVGNNDAILPFLSNKSGSQELLLDPLCIAFQDGEVLDVFIDDYQQPDGAALDSSFFPSRQLRRQSRMINELTLSMGLSVANIMSAQWSAIGILQHTFQFRDYSSPRLFIILPTSASNTDICLGEFRLFYLCECGRHTRNSESSKTSSLFDDSKNKDLLHNIHLVDNNGGLKITDLPSFMEKYGAYTLALLRMVKYGAKGGNMVINRSLTFNGLDNHGNGLDRFEERVDLAILYMEQYLYFRPSPSSPNLAFSLTTVPTHTTSGQCIPTPHWLRNEKFHDVKSFLEDYNDSEENGTISTPYDLYKITTAKEGHVRWLCYEHFDGIYSELERVPILQYVNYFDYNEHIGFIHIRLPTPSYAIDFYQTFAQTPHLQELHMFLDWIVLTYDIHELEKAIKKSHLLQIELCVQCAKPDNFAQYTDAQQLPKLYKALNDGVFSGVYLENQNGHTVQVRFWPNTFNSACLFLGTQVLERYEFPMLNKILLSSNSIKNVEICVQKCDFETVLDLMESFIKKRKIIRGLAIETKSGPFINMSFEEDSIIPSNVVAQVPTLEAIAHRVQLESITSLILTNPYTLAEVELLLQILPACCTSLKNISFTLAKVNRESLSTTSPVSHSSANLKIISLSFFELGSLSTLETLTINHGNRWGSSKFDFPIKFLDLRDFDISLEDENIRMDRLFDKNPLLSMLRLTAGDLMEGYSLLEPLTHYSRKHDIAVRFDHIGTGHLEARFLKRVHSGGVQTPNCVPPEIDLCTSNIKLYGQPLLSQVKTLKVLNDVDINQNCLIQYIIQECTSLESLNITYKDIMSLSLFYISSIPTLQKLRLSQKSLRYLTEYNFPIKRLDFGEKMVTLDEGPVTIEKFFMTNPLLTDLSLTVNDLGQDLPKFFEALRSVHKYRLVKLRLNDQTQSFASILFTKDNSISSYKLHLTTLNNQEDLQKYEISYLTDFVLSGECPDTVHTDTLVNGLVADCSELESIDIYCRSNYLSLFFQLCDMAAPKKWILRHHGGYVTSSLISSDGFLNLSFEVLPKTLFKNLERYLQAHQAVTSLKIMVNSTMKAFVFVTSLASKVPWLKEVKIIQVNVGPRMVVSFSDNNNIPIIANVSVGDSDRSERTWSIALDIQNMSQLQSLHLYPFLTKLTLSGKVMIWENGELEMIPLAICENLSILEIKCPPSQFPRILRSMHEIALMHPSFRHLKLWDGTRNNILTGSQIDDLDEMTVRLDLLKLSDFESPFCELEHLLQDYPIEILHIDLDPSFTRRQAEIIEKSMTLGKVHIRHIQWDISGIHLAPLFEIMYRAISHCQYSALHSSSKHQVVPTIALKVSKPLNYLAGISIFTPSTTSTSDQRTLSTFGRFIAQFVTHLILIHTGFENFLSNLIIADLEVLQELDIRVYRYCPDAEILTWIKSLLKRKEGDQHHQQQPQLSFVERKINEQIQDEEEKEVEVEEVEEEEESISGDYYTDFDSDGSIISSPPRSPTQSWAQSPIAVSPTAVPIPPFVRQPLRRLTLHNLNFTSWQWKELIESIDFFTFELLNLERGGFSNEEFVMLTTRYIDQMTTAYQASNKKDDEIDEKVAKGDDEEEEEENEEREEEEKERKEQVVETKLKARIDIDAEKEGECVIRLYSTTVSHWQVVHERTRLYDKGCSRLKIEHA
ncbi:hypothetical protein FBU30_004704 [Linnemannia zychae]|nr:hypothetical protein FBU30_004704 [Linnemannia zychae]